MTIALTAYATHHSEGLNITVISSLWWITLHEEVDNPVHAYFPNSGPTFQGDQR